MNELKPEDVMKALECCNTKGNCNQCPYEIVGEYTPCYSVLTQDALALLREKDAEIERLNIELQAMRGAANSYKMQLETAQKDFLDYQADVQMEIDDARAEAITEMEKRLEQIGTPLMHTYVVTRMDIKQVVKDMKDQTEKGG